MTPDYSSPREEAILSVLGGLPVEEAAARAHTSPARLADAVERYRAAGRVTLDTPPVGWYQVNITFADYPSAQRTFRAHLLPALRSGPVGAWWFVRKYPCWRLRIHPDAQAQVEEVIEHVTDALDSAASSGAVEQWRPSLYERETVAFGGPDGITLAHSIFHVDSAGVLDYRQLAEEGTEEILDAKATSLLIVTMFLRAARLEWAEQGDVWSQVEARRPLPDDVPKDKVSSMAEAVRQLFLIDPGPAFADGPLAPLRSWAASMERGGRALADAAAEQRLRLGLRGVLARHVLFHWNRMGFTTTQQAIWSRAAREAVLDP